MKKRIAELERENKVLDQTVTLQNEQYAKEIRKLTRAHKKELRALHPISSVEQADASRTGSISSSSEDNTTSDPRQPSRSSLSKYTPKESERLGKRNKSEEALRGTKADERDSSNTKARSKK